jgi:hypothetical protein
MVVTDPSRNIAKSAQGLVPAVSCIGIVLVAFEYIPPEGVASKGIITIPPEGDINGSISFLPPNKLIRQRGL